MLVSEMINALQEILNNNGDQEVRIYDERSGQHLSCNPALEYDEDHKQHIVEMVGKW